MATEKLPAPDGGWGWFIVLGTAINHLLIGVVVRTIGVYYLEFEKRFHASATVTAWIPSVALGLWNGLGPLTSLLCNRFGERKVAMSGALLTAAGLMITGLTSNIIVTYFSFGVLLGCGLSFIYLTGTCLVGEYFDKGKAGAMGTSAIGSSLGAFVGPPLVQFLFDYYGYFGGFLLLSGIGLQTCVSAALFWSLETYNRLTNRSKKFHKLRENECDIKVKSSGDVIMVMESGECDSEEMRKLMGDESKESGTQNKNLDLVCRKGSLENAEKDYHSKVLNINQDADSIIGTGKQSVTEKYLSSTRSLQSLEESVNLETEYLEKQKQMVTTTETSTQEKSQRKIFDWSLFREVKFVIVSLTFFAMSICLGAVITFLPAMAIDKNMGQTRAVFLLSVVGIADGITRIPLGFLLDVPLVRRYRIWVYFLFQLLCGLIVMLLPLPSNYWVLVALTASRGLASSILMPQRLTIMGDMFGEERAGSALSLQMFTMAIGAIIGRTLGGIFKDFLGQYDPIFYLGGALQIVASCILMLLLYLRPESQARANTVQEITVTCDNPKTSALQE